MHKSGRPKIPEQKKKVRVTVTLSPVALRMIDDAREEVSRSSYIESMLPHSHEEIRQRIKAQGAIYTPSDLAQYVGEKLTQYYSEYFTNKYKRLPAKKLSSLRILDPACGNGELLDATWASLRTSLSELFLTRIEPLSPNAILCAVDLDRGAVAATEKRILSLRPDQKNVKAKCIHTNALFPFEAATAEAGWERIRSECDAENGFDMIVANPPWGASTKAYKSQLDRGEYQLCKGQYDTADLFVEQALAQLKPEGFMAFILPDSLFQAERSPLRELILKSTRIMYIARLGEKIFKDVNRACVVLICQKGKAPAEHQIDCMRLTPQHRSRILAGEISYANAEAELHHKIYQSRLLLNPKYIFDIDLRDSELNTVEKIRKTSSTFGSYLVSSRGVELSKTGNVRQCPSCNLWMPLPQSKTPVCGHCKRMIEPTTAKTTSIVSKTKKEQSAPLLVGESITRYQATISKWIETNKNGINYKNPDIYAENKIVVRKTGVGISAALDSSGSFTNQVVYMLKAKNLDAGSIPLEFFLGVLNSRAIYYYLVKSHGETEWRSHPYLTQQQILELPLPPHHILLGKEASTVSAIARLVRKYSTKGTPPPANEDAEIERLVAKSFGLTKRDYKWIYNTLDDVQQLLPIRALKTITVDQIFSSQR